MIEVRYGKLDPPEEEEEKSTIEFLHHRFLELESGTHEIELPQLPMWVDRRKK
jgi:hypothetical protein